MSDIEQLAFAKQQNRTIITADQDFLRIAAVDQDHAGIIFCSRPQRIGDLIKAVDALCFQRPDDDFRGTVTFV